MEFWTFMENQGSNIETEIKALEEYQDNGKVVTVRCERCNELLKVEQLGKTAQAVSCSCGLYNDVLRGL